ncbi:hypothetical protein E6H34_03315 [Candidatus Bathyarchaeota archaeon]|nr:MAG: hypothetical protein E6H34_03315 [Candidatus Bathyarchaeota archaeon]
MQFKLVVLGLALLVVGLVTYALIPAVHTTPVVNDQNVWVQNGFPVQARSLVEQPKNITAFSGMTNELRANVTVSEPGVGAPTIRFELLAMNNSLTCSPSSSPPTVLVDQTVVNESFNIPLKATGTYCFVFDNQGSQSSKTVDISARVLGSTEKVLIARDGNANAAGLGLGALGLVVVIYGYSRKTIIPWE